MLGTKWKAFSSERKAPNVLKKRFSNTPGQFVPVPRVNIFQHRLFTHQNSLKKTMLQGTSPRTCFCSREMS